MLEKVLVQLLRKLKTKDANELFAPVLYDIITVEYFCSTDNEERVALIYLVRLLITCLSS